MRRFHSDYTSTATSRHEHHGSHNTLVPQTETCAAGQGMCFHCPWGEDVHHLDMGRGGGCWGQPASSPTCQRIITHVKMIFTLGRRSLRTTKSASPLQKGNLDEPKNATKCTSFGKPGTIKTLCLLCFALKEPERGSRNGTQSERWVRKGSEPEPYANVSIP